MKTFKNFVKTFLLVNLKMISLFALIMLFIASLVTGAHASLSFFEDKEIAMLPVQVILTLLSALLAGGFTLAGVQTTFKQQDKKDFTKEFPLKIYHLDSILEQLAELKGVTSKTNVPLLITKRDYIESLFKSATEVDGYIYFKIREAHIGFSSIIDQMYLEPEKLCNKDEWGVWLIEQGNEEEYQIKLLAANKIVVDLENLVGDYRSKFIGHYNEVIDSSIYKKLDK